MCAHTKHASLQTGRTARLVLPDGIKERKKSSKSENMKLKQN